jgi:hypothetical protein
MGKLIAKTAIATLGAIIALLLVLFMIFHFFVPSVMLKTTSAFGMDKSALKYSVKVYERSNDLDDLKDVLYRANDLDDYAVVVKYSPKMFEDDGFVAFCDSQPVSEISYKSYVISSYIFALQEDGATPRDIIDKSKNLYDAFYVTGYEAYNPYHALATVALSFDNAGKDEVLSLLNNVVCDGQDAQLLNANVSTIINSKN